jgi:hypothetical protein
VAWGIDDFAPNVIFALSAVPAIAYQDVKTVSVDEKTLQVNGATFVRCESEAEANIVRERLERLKALPPNKREAVIREFVSAAFAEKAVVDQMARVTRATRFVRILSTTLCSVLVLAFPLLLLMLRVPDAFVILPLGALTLLLAVAISVSFAKAGGQLHPEQRVKYRWKSVKFLVYPVGAMRALDELTLDALAGIHPVVFSLVLGKGARRLKEVKSLWQQAHSPFPMTVQADAKALERSLWFNELVCQEMKSYLAQKLPAALEEESVQRQNSACVSYCPNCKTQYVTKTGTCADCQGVALRAFADDPKTIAR